MNKKKVIKKANSTAKKTTRSPASKQTAKKPSKTAKKPSKTAKKPSKTAKKKVSKKTNTTKKVVPAKNPKSKKPKNLPEFNSNIKAKNINLSANYRPNDNEEYMNEMQLAYFEAKLNQWKDELINQSQETLYHLKTESRDVSDEAERASRESDNILELRTRDRYRKLLAKIDSALRRIGDGTYGFCEETGEEIGLGRLEARPTATLTVDAQERREMFQKQFRDDR